MGTQRVPERRQFDALRDTQAFRALLEEAEAGRQAGSGAGGPGGQAAEALGDVGGGGGVGEAQRPRAAAGIERVRRSAICFCSVFTLSTSSV